MFGSLWQTASLQSQSQILIVIFICLCVCMCVSVFWYLVLASVPVVEQACRDQKGVVLMAVLAIVPATVVANLCLSSGKSNWMLTPWQERHLVNTSIYFAHIVSDIRVMFVIIGHTEDYWSYFKMGGKSKREFWKCYFWREITNYVHLKFMNLGEWETYFSFKNRWHENCWVSIFAITKKPVKP